MFWKWSTPAQGVDWEQRLVAAARKSDRAAFDSLIQTHLDRLRTFLIRRVGADAAEDVLQETLVAAWQGMPRLDLRVRFKTWLFSIAVHKAADHHRAHGRMARQEIAIDTAHLPAANDAVEAAERRLLVNRVLASLNDEQRQIVEMYYFAELTLPEIAGILGRNLNTLKYQFYRIHAVTAEAFAAEDEEQDGTTSLPETGTSKKDGRISRRKGVSVTR